MKTRTDVDIVVTMKTIVLLIMIVACAGCGENVETNELELSRYRYQYQQVVSQSMRRSKVLAPLSVNAPAPPARSSDSQMCASCRESTQYLRLAQFQAPVYPAPLCSHR